MESAVKSQVVNELHKPARKNYPRRKVVIKGKNDLWQIDLVEMIPYARENKGYRYLLTIIDTFSKFAWAVPIKRKTGEEVTKAMQSVIISSNQIPNNIQSDLGKEFYNSKFKSLMEKYGINHYSTFSNMKASIVERLNRTLKTKMWRVFSLRGSHKFLDILPKLLQEYNSSFHRTLGMRPIDVNSKKVENFLLNNVYLKKSDKKMTKQRFNEDDYVRISKHKTIFSKGYEPNWSTEIFKISKVQNTNPYTYLLHDLKGQPIKGSFYSEELQKVKYPNVYLIEKIIKKRQGKMYVKWLGLREKSWVKESDIV